MDHIWLRESTAEYDSVCNKHDKGYKYLLSAKKVFVELLKSFVRQGWVDQIDENNIFCGQVFYIAGFQRQGIRFGLLGQIK